MTAPQHASDRTPAPQSPLGRLRMPRVFNARGRQRFTKERTDGLLDHLGAAPSRPQLVLIGRIVRAEWDLLRLDAVMDSGELSQHAMRTRLAMENRLRLDLQALGLKPAAAKPPTLAEIAADIAAARDRDAAA